MPWVFARVGSSVVWLHCCEVPRTEQALDPPPVCRTARLEDSARGARRASVRGSSYISVRVDSFFCRPAFAACVCVNFGRSERVAAERVAAERAVDAREAALLADQLAAESAPSVGPSASLLSMETAAPSPAPTMSPAPPAASAAAAASRRVHVVFSTACSGYQDWQRAHGALRLVICGALPRAPF